MSETTVTTEETHASEESINAAIAAGEETTPEQVDFPTDTDTRTFFSRDYGRLARTLNIARNVSRFGGPKGDAQVAKVDALAGVIAAALLSDSESFDTDTFLANVTKVNEAPAANDPPEYEAEEDDSEEATLF